MIIINSAVIISALLGIALGVLGYYYTEQRDSIANNSVD
jgi:ABC-type proline/glycine betaine transport system permease subunit